MCDTRNPRLKENTKTLNLKGHRVFPKDQEKHCESLCFSKGSSPLGHSVRTHGGTRTVTSIFVVPSSLSESGTESVGFYWTGHSVSFRQGSWKPRSSGQDIRSTTMMTEGSFTNITFYYCYKNPKVSSFWVVLDGSLLLRDRWLKVTVDCVSHTHHVPVWTSKQDKSSSQVYLTCPGPQS